MLPNVVGLERLESACHEDAIVAFRGDNTLKKSVLFLGIILTAATRNYVMKMIANELHQ